MDPSGRNDDVNANSFVVNQVMWATLDLCVCVWTVTPRIYSDHMSVS